MDQSVSVGRAGAGEIPQSGQGYAEMVLCLRQVKSVVRMGRKDIDERLKKSQCFSVVSLRRRKVSCVRKESAQIVAGDGEVICRLCLLREVNDQLFPLCPRFLECGPRSRSIPEFYQGDSQTVTGSSQRQAVFRFAGEFSAEFFVKRYRPLNGASGSRV